MLATFDFVAVWVKNRRLKTQRTRSRY